MTRNLYSVIIYIIIITSSSSSSLWGNSYNEKWSEENDNTEHFPKNEFVTLLNDIWAKLGMDQIVDTSGFYLRSCVRAGKEMY